MLVCDRRSQTKVAPTQIPTTNIIGSKSSSSNRAKAIEEFEARNEELMLSTSSSTSSQPTSTSTSTSQPTTNKEKDIGEIKFKGCKVIVGTGGQEKLREDLFRKIWGV